MDPGILAGIERKREKTNDKNENSKLPRSSQEWTNSQYSIAEIRESNVRASEIDEFVISQDFIKFVIPKKAGIQLFQDILHRGFRRGDNP